MKIIFRAAAFPPKNLRGILTFGIRPANSSTAEWTKSTSILGVRNSATYLDKRLSIANLEQMDSTTGETAIQVVVNVEVFYSSGNYEDYVGVVLVPAGKGGAFPP